MIELETAKRLIGEIELPGDKSISHRVIMLGAIAKGRTVINNLLDSDDSNFTIRAFKEMGIGIKKRGKLTVIEGNGLKGLKKPTGVLHVGDSGTTMRLLAGILAGQPFEVTLTGDKALSNRPMRRIVEPLSLMGVQISAAGGDLPPLTVRGGNVKAIDYRMEIPSAQVKSAILFAALYAAGMTRVAEKFKSRDHTERMMKHFGADIKVDGLNISLEGGRELMAKSVEVPGDLSSASFFMAGATLLKGSRIKIKGVGLNPTRCGIMDILSRMGGDIKITRKGMAFEPAGDVEVRYAETKGIVIDEGIIPNIIDELPVIFVLASLSKGITVIKGTKELRVKETDRIASMEENLRKMGARIFTEGDTVTIEGGVALKGADLKSFGDHRTCMAMVITALCAKEGSTIDDVECMSKSFPGFFQILKKIAR